MEKHILKATVLFYEEDFKGFLNVSRERAKISGSECLAAYSNVWCMRAGGSVTQLCLGRRDLEDVFLSDDGVL